MNGLVILAAAAAIVFGINQFLKRALLPLPMWCAVSAHGSCSVSPLS